MTSGQLIKDLRLKKGITQEELAAKTYISARTIQRIENGDVVPRGYTLKTIANALEVNIEELINYDKTVPEEFKLKDNDIWLLILHLSGLFILLFPPVIIWLWKKDKIKNVREHGIDVINFQFSMLLYIFPLALLTFLIITIPILVFVGIYSMVIIIINTIKVMNNQPYKYPITLRVLKP